MPLPNANRGPGDYGGVRHHDESKTKVGGGKSAGQT